MAKEQVEFELVSPEKLLLSQSVDMVVVPGEDGDFGVLPRHAPMISTVRPGVIAIYSGKEISERIFVAGGFAEVTTERCTVLAEIAQPVGEIDKAAVQQQLQDAKEDLSDAKDDDARDAARKQIGLSEAMLAAIG
ncbi:ATP synthase subunit epsilon [Kiloniella litopenaei]|uniref:ATP synthase epsilon chain n=1 Tax=Kiloniella litopenaei TaxID=1549748 RepID=A0A0M2R530_9PROT|nr:MULTISPECIES: F0F1 ATP synthase subunit epsilon [Kiloniella]KKJ75564.1 ATP synthase subunit epsilon [Kiloniella litopenaei]